MRKTLVLLALTCLPALANVPFGETTVIDNLNVIPLTYGLLPPGFPQLPGLVPQVQAPGVTFSIQDNRETPDYVIVIATIQTQDGETKKYTALQKWSDNGYRYCTVLIPLTSAPVAITNLMIATMSKGEVHSAN
jgi:hypothetical protein